MLQVRKCFRGCFLGAEGRRLLLVVIHDQSCHFFAQEAGEVVVYSICGANVDARSHP
jgi:hypothetical protein